MARNTPLPILPRPLIEQPSHSPDFSPLDYFCEDTNRRAVPAEVRGIPSDARGADERQQNASVHQRVLVGKRLADQEDLQKTILEYYKQFDKQQYREGMFKRMSRWDKCLNVYEDYVEN
ncbi:hypothetical protein AVEN_214925-1 [Araneus ventricosus]|uniref:Uncharacterized protein n=1 Tax=Araneus ventricosus TaxID=182803 RepID=A0A4Y2D8V7_ARAVE|nr:hypothetical protein AVEN_214925-1 [Araneus ventricosus]